MGAIRARFYIGSERLAPRRARVRPFLRDRGRRARQTRVWSAGFQFWCWGTRARVKVREQERTDCFEGNAQIATTKGTGGDVIILEEAAYIDPRFFYETVAPLLIMGNTSLLAISTLTSDINFYTRLLRMRDPATEQPMFVSLSVELACRTCIDQGKATECVHRLHLVPRQEPPPSLIFTLHTD